MAKKSQTIAPVGSNSAAPAPIPGELCPDEIALLFNVNRRTITRWEKDRIISKRGRNFPTVETVQAVLNYFQTSTDQKLRKLRIEADSKQIDLDLKRRNLISLEEQEDWLRATIGLVVIDILAAPSRYAKAFPEIDSIVVQERLNEMAEEIVSNLSKRFTHTLENIKDGKAIDSE